MTTWYDESWRGTGSSGVVSNSMVRYCNSSHPLVWLSTKPLYNHPTSFLQISYAGYVGWEKYSHVGWYHAHAFIAEHVTFIYHLFALSYTSARGCTNHHTTTLPPLPSCCCHFNHPSRLHSTHPNFIVISFACNLLISCPRIPHNPTRLITTTHRSLEKDRSTSTIICRLDAQTSFPQSKPTN